MFRCDLDPLQIMCFFIAPNDISLPLYLIGPLPTLFEWSSPKNNKREEQAVREYGQA
jgi:hypothetical protein